MDHPNPVYRVGAATITRIDELRLTGATPADFYPGADPAAWEPHLARLGPGSYAPASHAAGAGTLVLSVHAWLVRTPTRTVLVDTAAGNGKDLPDVPMLDQLDTPFLSRLAAAGVRPEEVDAVLLTHVHADHVGWNTERRDGVWRPVFPRARHVFSAKEEAYAVALDRGGAVDPETIQPGLGRMVRRPAAGVYAQSLRPIVAAGLATRVAVDGREVLPGFSFLPTPGHSIDHASIRLRSEGEEALFSGDVFHHPLQVHEPGLASRFCEFPEAAGRSRQAVLEDAAANDVPVFTSHFAETSVGRVRREGDRFAWDFL